MLRRESWLAYYRDKNCRMTEQLSQAKNLAERLLGIALDVVHEARITLDQDWARNPKVVGLTLLSRSMTNFRAAMVLLYDQHVHTIEARVLARCIYENLLWIAALRERGADFVKDMLKDEAFNRQAIGTLALELSKKSRGDVDDEAALMLRELIRSTNKEFPGSKKLSANNIARGTSFETAYVEYSRLSLDAVHCSVTALGRHLSREVEDKETFLTVNVHPTAAPKEVLDTLIVLCRGLLGVTIGANELLGGTSKNESLRTLSDELDAILVP